MVVRIIPPPSKKFALHSKWGGIISTFTVSKLSEDEQKMTNIQHFLPVLQRGIGVHHGGMLPILK